jgi:membrane protein DedA with SNARE-associated domain
MQSEFVTALLAWVAAHPGWMSAVIFISAAAESLTIVGVIVPGALVMFSLGALIGLGHLDFWSAYWWSALGAVIGDAISFWIGRVFHQGVRRVWPFVKHPEMIARSEEFFRKHGGKGVLFGRFFGPVRGTIPTVAGMMDMTWRNFMVANVVSAVLWSPAYLIPGMAFGASLDIASRVAGRLVVLILIVAVLLWGTTWLVRHLVRLFQTHAADWLQRFCNWSRGRRFIGPVSASLLDPAQGELRGLATLAVLLLGSVVLFSLSLSAAGQKLPSGLDQSLYHFFQELRTPWADALMVFTAELGDYQRHLARESGGVRLADLAAQAGGGLALVGSFRVRHGYQSTVQVVAAGTQPNRDIARRTAGLFVPVQPRDLQYLGVRVFGGPPCPRHSTNPSLDRLSGGSVHDRARRVCPAVSGHTVAHRYAGGFVSGPDLGGGARVGLQPPLDGNTGELARVAGIQHDCLAGSRFGACQFQLSRRSATLPTAVSDTDAGTGTMVARGLATVAAAAVGFSRESPARFRAAMGRNPRRNQEAFASGRLGARATTGFAEHFAVLEPASRAAGIAGAAANPRW